MKKFDNFEDAIEFLHENHNDVTTEDILIDFVKHNIDNDSFGLALHVLTAIYEDRATSGYYQYDYSMGTCETPTGLETLEDIAHLLADFEEDETK